MTGIIIKGIGGFYYVKTADSDVYECKARGIFRKENIKPAIGDRVEIEIENSKGSIVKIHERRTFLVRPPVSNIDNLMIVVAAKNPDPNLFLIDKMIVTAEYRGITPIICINKTDLSDGAELEKIYENTGYRVLRVSTYENKGIDELKQLLKGKITAFAGLSGVGKSSILNKIMPDAAKTGEISSKIKRGKHTTRHIELFETNDGGFLLDTPGFSSFELENIPADELQNYFPEMHDLDKQCRFKGCAHKNEPDCAVKEKLQSGELSPQRYENYLAMYDILKTRKDWN